MPCTCSQASHPPGRKRCHLRFCRDAVGCGSHQRTPRHKGLALTGTIPSSFIASNKNNPWSAQILSCAVTTSIYNINKTTGQYSLSTLKSFQELETEESFHQQQFPSKGERALWLRWRHRRPGSAPPPWWPQLCCAMRTAQDVALSQRQLWGLGSVAVLARREPGHCPGETQPSSVLTRAQPPCSVSTSSCTNSFSLSPSPTTFLLYKSSGNNLKIFLFP